MLSNMQGSGYTFWFHSISLFLCIRQLGVFVMMILIHQTFEVLDCFNSQL